MSLLSVFTYNGVLGRLARLFKTSTEGTFQGWLRMGDTAEDRGRRLRPTTRDVQRIPGKLRGRRNGSLKLLRLNENIERCGRHTPFVIARHEMLCVVQLNAGLLSK